jgi:hypothetical protein
MQLQRYIEGLMTLGDPITWVGLDTTSHLTRYFAVQNTVQFMTASMVHVS